MTQDTKKDDEGAAVTEAGRSNGRSEQLWIQDATILLTNLPETQAIEPGKGLHF
jgi:hypothetical protein